MTYSEVRQAHPNTWLLLEAFKAHSQDEYRILEDLAVLNVFETSLDALKAYRELHQINPTRELYVVHSSKPELIIKERVWLGIRSAA
jgi:hypothetical protein